MDAIQSVVATYGKAWLEPDEDARRALLEASWADDGLYQDPSADVRGREALIAHIGGFHKQQPGARIELTSGASHHHGRVHFSWQMVTADGAVALQGVDFGTLGDDGRLTQIIGFFGAPPAL